MGLPDGKNAVDGLDRAAWQLALHVGATLHVAPIVNIAGKFDGRPAHTLIDGAVDRVGTTPDEVVVVAALLRKSTKRRFESSFNGCST